MSKPELATLLETIIDEQVDAPEVALLLSGGVDSVSIGLAAMATKRKVHAYTFQIEDVTSPDSLSARKAAECFGWPFTLVKLTTANLQREFTELADRWACVKKTQYECSWPYLQTAPVVKQKHVLSGLGADTHHGLSKKAMMHFRTPKHLFDQYRQEGFDAPNTAGRLQQRAIFGHYGMKCVHPYFDTRVHAYFMRYDWDQLNRPRQKSHIVQAYAAGFRKFGVRKHANFQIVAGIPAVFESLLSSPLNQRGRTRVLDLCRDHARRVEKDASA